MIADEIKLSTPEQSWGSQCESPVDVQASDPLFPAKFVSLDKDVTVRDSDSSHDPIPIIIAFDVEPDAIRVDRNKPEPWRGFEQGASKVEELRARITRATGRSPHFTWSIRGDLQVAETYGSADWAYRTYEREFTAHCESGDDLAVHTHMYRWDSSLNDWVQDLTDPDHIRFCLQTGFESYRRYFGQPQTHSIGLHWMNNLVRDQLVEYGIRHDLSLTPQFPEDTTSNPVWHVIGESVDGRRIRPEPYQSTRADFRVATTVDPSPLWFIPLSSQPHVRHFGFRPLWNFIHRKIKGARKPTTHRYLMRLGPDNFRTDFCKKLATRDSTHFHIVVRTAVFDKPRIYRNLVKSIDWMLSHPQAARFRFTTAAETIELLGLAGSPAKSSIAA